MSAAKKMPEHVFLKVDENDNLKTVTIIYYKDDSLMLHNDVKTFRASTGGRVVLPDSYRKGKSIVAVCEGNVNILNKVGDRVLPTEHGDLQVVQ